jgi:tRNA modification GTPase
MIKHPIVAIATPPGSGGVSIIRVSGQQIIGLAELLLAKPPKTRYAHHFFINDAQGNRLDEALLIFFKGPASFTGEDVIELHCHGGARMSQAILNRVLELGNDWGIKQAEAGEFSLRAYLNGKIDLVQAEAIADLINAHSDAAIKGAARSLQGQFSDSVNQLIEEITQLRILVESTLDFPEEEIEFLESSKANERLASILKKLQDLVEKTQQGKILRDGIRLALVGPPNVGKSSLLNCLLGEERAIVTPVAGTTRDRIEESITLQGVPVHLVDTAGLRASADVVEQIGIARTWDAIEDADTIIFMRDLSTKQSGEDSGLEEKVKAHANKKAHIIEVFNKLDLVDSQKRQLGISTSEKNTIHISAKTGDGIDALKERILSLAGWQANLAAGIFTARDRHLSAIAEAKESLLKAQAHGLNGNHSLDLFAEELRLSQDALGQITGKLLPDELLGKIFSEFCIGK